MVSGSSHSDTYRSSSHSAWAKVASNKETRSRRTRRPTVFQYRADAPIHLVPAGTALVLFAREQNENLERTRHALAHSDSETLEQLASHFSLHFGASEPSSISSTEEAADLLLQEPVYADLRYESRVIAPLMVAPERRPLGGMLIPYIGGPLYSDNFMYEEYLSSTEGPGLDVVVIAQEPNLSPLERAMVNDAAAAETGMVLGSGDYALKALPGVLGAIALMTALGTLCVAPSAEMDSVHLNGEDISRMGTAASAHKLLRMREEILLRNM
jgi:hypothetical protein